MADSPGGSLVTLPADSRVLAGRHWGQETEPLCLGAVLGVRTWYSLPVYWPQKETLSGRLVPPAPFILSRVDWALSSVAWLFSENR